MTQRDAEDDPHDARVPLARRLRRESTDAERALWGMLRAGRLTASKFRRQRRFGPHILDFYCVEKHLAVEADGSQHLTPDGLRADRRRTKHLEQRGVRVLRFTDRQILMEREGVLAVIERVLAER